MNTPHHIPQNMPMQTHIPPPQPPTAVPIPHQASHSMPNLGASPHVAPGVGSSTQQIPPDMRSSSYPAPPPLTAAAPIVPPQGQQTTASGTVEEASEPPLKKPKLQKQPTFEDLSRSIDQQGHSINDIISRINNSQQETSGPIDNGTGTINNGDSNFDLDDFLNNNEDLIDGEVTNDDLINKVGSIEEIFDDIKDSSK